MSLESQFGACAVRISRLATDGTPDYGNSSGALCFVGGVNKFKHDFETEKGKEVYETDACGSPIVTFKLDDVTKWATFELTLGRSDDRLAELCGLGQVLGSPSSPTGFTIDAAGGCEVGGKATVAIELWRQRRDCASLMDPPYKRVILPQCTLSPQGFDSTDAVALPVYSGISQANSNFLDGPFNDLDDLEDLHQWCYAEVIDDEFCDQPDPFTYTALPANLTT